MKEKKVSVVITNPMQVPCNYYWLPGVTIPAGTSLTLNYDPRVRAAGVHRSQLLHDLEANLVRIEESLETPLPEGVSPDGPIGQVLRQQSVQRADAPDVPKPITVNLNDKLGWKPIQTVVQSEPPPIDLETARTKTIGNNSQPVSSGQPFGMPPEVIKAQADAQREAELKAAAAEAAVAAYTQVHNANKPKRQYRRKKPAATPAVPA